ncbi:MAG: sigma-70 family RNA polymerase sigma factor [Myxococcales bacterium]|nr:sigma-70 family RNA polymerase sigma factor [Myxococcales bacterium]
MTGDRELVEAYMAGDRGAGKQLVDRYYGRVLGFFRNKAPAASNDLAQRTFLGCFEALGRLRDRSRFRSFLFAVACNQLRKHYRGKRRDGDHLDFTHVSAADLDPSPSGVIAERQEQRLLLEGLRRIPLDYQIVLELVYWEEMTAADVAATLDLPLGTAKTRIRRGRQLLEHALAELGSAGDVLTATISDLEGWAAGLRGQALAS